MTIWTDLELAIETEAVALGYTGTLAEIGIDQPYPAKLITLLEIRSKLADITSGSGATTQIIGIFRAIASGTGYAIDDLILLRQTQPDPPEWVNITTNTVIAAPDPADLSDVSAASNVTVVAPLPSGTNTIGQVTANAGTNLNTSALALDATLTISNTRIGDLAESAPASDTASSGLNGRLQRIAQRLTSLIALLPASLGQKTMANSLAVAIASDQSAITINSAHSEFTDNFTAPSAGTSHPMNGYTKAFITLAITNINTSVTFRIEGSNDNTNWANLDVDQVDTTYTANGTYSFSFQGCPQRIRVNFVSETGGTAATITTITRLAS